MIKQTTEAQSLIVCHNVEHATQQEVNETLIACLAEDTKQDKDKLRKLMERDHYMRAKEAVKFNIIDRVVNKFGAQKTKKTSI